MAQGNYYANLAMALSTQDTSSVANSISTALEGSTKAINSAYEAGKDANDAFSNLLDTKDTALGRVLDYYSTKEAKSNIEANKQKQLDEANKNVIDKQAETLAMYNSMENEYINNITRGTTGQSYDDIKSNLDKIISSASDGNLNYEQYMFYMNNPQLIREAQRFRNMSNGANETLDEVGNIIVSPVDVKVLETIEKLSANTNFTRLTSNMRDIEAEKERINKGIVTEEEFHQIYKDSRENAYKVAGAYDEKSFRDTMNVMSKKDILTNWRGNFNNGVPPVVWKEDPAKAIAKAEENAKSSSISADNVLKNAKPKPPIEKPKDDSVEGQVNTQVESLKEQRGILEEEQKNPEVIKKQEILSSQYNNTDDLGELIAKASVTGKIEIFDNRTDDFKNTGLVSGINNAVYNKIPNWIKILAPLYLGGGGTLQAYTYAKDTLTYIGEDGKPLTGEQAEAAKEADKQAGVKETDTKEEADKKRKSFREKFTDKMKEVKDADKKELAKKAGKTIGSKIISTGGKALQRITLATEAFGGIAAIEDSIAHGLGYRDINTARLSPTNRVEQDEYNEVFKGKEVSQYLIDSMYLMEKWDLGNYKTFLPGTVEDYQKQLAYFNNREKKLNKLTSLSFGGMVKDTFSADKAKEQVEVARRIISRMIEMKNLENKSIAGRIKKIDNDIVTLQDKVAQNIIDKDNFNKVHQEIANIPNTQGNGKKLTELKNKELELSANITGYNKSELVSNLTDGQINNPKSVTEDKYEFSLKATASLNDETRNSLAAKNVKVDSISKEEATVKWAFRGFIFDGSNGSANMSSIDKISKDKEVQKAVQELETVAASDTWGSLFTSKGKLNDAFEDLVSVLDEKFKDNPIRISSPLSPEEEKEFNHLKNQGFIKKDGLLNKTEAASKYAFKIMKFQIYKSQADPKHLDMSNNDNVRRFNQSKVLNYLYKYDEAKKIKNKSADDNYKIKSKSENFNEAKNSGTSNLYNSITIEKSKKGNKEASRISINGTAEQAKIDLDRALKIGDISQQQYDSLVKSLTRR